MRVKAPPHSAQALLAALAEALRASRPMGRRPSTCKHVACRPPIGRDGPGLFMRNIFAASAFHVPEARSHLENWAKGRTFRARLMEWAQILLLLAERAGIRPAETVGRLNRSVSSAPLLPLCMCLFA